MFTTQSSGRTFDPFYTISRRFLSSTCTLLVTGPTQTRLLASWIVRDPNIHNTHPPFPNAFFPSRSLINIQNCIPPFVLQESDPPPPDPTSFRNHTRSSTVADTGRWFSGRVISRDDYPDVRAEHKKLDKIFPFDAHWATAIILDDNAETWNQVKITRPHLCYLVQTMNSFMAPAKEDCPFGGCAHCPFPHGIVLLSCCAGDRKARRTEAKFD
jgi:hypothetical protein